MGFWLPGTVHAKKFQVSSKALYIPNENYNVLLLFILLVSHVWVLVNSDVFVPMSFYHSSILGVSQERGVMPQP